MNPLRRSRTAAGIAALLTAVAVVYPLALLAGFPDPSGAHLARGVLHLGELAAVVALALSGAAGTGLLARTGLGAAGLGEVLLVVAEVVLVSDPGLSTGLFAVAPALVGLGLVLAGIAVVRTGRWSGWRRGVPLGPGAYVFVVMTPVLIASGGPPAAASLWALAGWDALWLLIAVAVLVETTGTARHDATPVAGRTT